MQPDGQLIKEVLVRSISDSWLSKPRFAQPVGSLLKSESVKRLLLVGDDPADALLLREMFSKQGAVNIELTHVECMQDAERYLAKHETDVILLDVGISDAQGLDAVRRARAAAHHVPLVVLSGLDDESRAVQAMQEGAQDYLIKGQIEPRELMRALRNAKERKLIEETLFAEKERAQVTLDCIGDAVATTDVAGNVSFLNPVAEAMTGWPAEEAIGRPVTEIFHIVDAITRETVPSPMERAVKENKAEKLPLNCVLIQRDGGEVFIEDSIAPIHDRGAQPIGAVIVFRDVSKAHAMALQITHAAEHDYLTGLPNRLLLSDRIGQAIAFAQRHNKWVAVLFLDMDGFKHINDSLGHAVGDRLLQSIANCLRECVRSSDTVSRQGGDEFVVLISEVDSAQDAGVSAKRILGCLAKAHSIEGNDLHITTSIGVSVYPDDGLDAETLIKNADTAMYQAKENGRQSYQFFTPDMSVRAVERQSIEEGLRVALQRHEFAVHYQPKVNLITGEITGAEALLRWMHPTRGNVPPDQFIPVAEDSGLILPIGRWVLREACRQARAWTDAGLPQTSVAVNVSAIEFRDEGFLENVFAILAETKLDPSFLELELTESVLMREAEAAEVSLKALRMRGIRIAIDDFGTGYSSLSYLRKFSIDALKIDRSFIRQITTTPEETTIVSAILSMGRSLKLRVIAEGVETHEELSFLRAHLCDEAQGYYFSRPVRPQQFIELLESAAVV